MSGVSKRGVSTKNRLLTKLYRKRNLSLCASAKRTICFFVIFNVAVLRLFSQGLNDNENEKNNGETVNRITAISVLGLKRTKPHIIENPLQKFIGMDEQDVDVNKVYAVIEDVWVLEPLTIDITDNEEGTGKTLVVTVREKWSLLAGPYFNAGSGGWSAGAVVFEANAFGIKDTMLAMGIYGKSEWSAHLAYTSTPDAAGGFGFIIDWLLHFQNNEKTDQTVDKIFRRFNTLTINPSVSVMYSLTDLLTPSLCVSYRNSLLRETENPLNDPEDGIQAVTITPGIGIRHSSWDGYLLSEKSADLNYNYSIGVGSKDMHSVTLDAMIQHSIVPGFRVASKVGLLFSSSSDVPYFEKPPVSAINILPITYSAANYAGLSLGLEKHLFKFRYGTVAASLVYQIVYSDGEFLRNQFDHGPAFFAQWYFSRLAVPGLALGGAYNVAKRHFEFAFSTGVNF
jgi:hypothetical protein